MNRTTGTALLTLAIEPKTSADQVRLLDGLRELMADDPTLRMRSDPVTGETVIHATGEPHLEIIVDRLTREFNVAASVGRPQVVYKAALTKPADGEMKYADQIGGRGQYAHVKIHLYPGKPSSGYVFEDRISGGAIPKEFEKAVDEGIQQALTGNGILAGYPVDDVRIELYDGSYHDVDSSQIAFTIAGWKAFEDAAKKAGPMLLEPVMHVEVSIPKEYIADVIRDLEGRRAHIESQEDRGVTHIISARVPLADLFGYSHHLHECTRGRGGHIMELDHYQPCQRPRESDDSDRESFVGAPRKPSPTLRNSQVALPEPPPNPEDDDESDLRDRGLMQ
jgi:elongation factor G